MRTKWTQAKEEIWIDKLWDRQKRMEQKMWIDTWKRNKVKNSWKNIQTKRQTSQQNEKD